MASPIIKSIAQLDMSGTYSYADYLNWQFDEYVEIIKGKVFRLSPAPSRKHQRVSWLFSIEIGDYLKRRICQAYHSPFDVRLTTFDKKKNKEITTVVQPDICVICDPSKLDDAGCIGAPDLIIEILSPGNTKKEMKQKYNVYEESGVKEYWLVHPHDYCVLVYQLNEQGRYVGKPPLTEDDVLTTPLFPGLEINLAEIFEIEA